MKTSSLDLIVGEKLSSVTFVLSYLQLSFDGPTLTCFEWPRLFVGGTVDTFTSETYRNKLCSLIEKIVVAVDEKDESISAQFENGDHIDLMLRGDAGSEVAMFADFKDHVLQVWHC
jgi:hypothetical protein